jgi:hypothetical protein
MEMMFNELSETPVSNNKALANQKVAALIECHKKARENGFQKIRFSKNFHKINIANGYNLEQWLNETNQRTYKALILSARTFPFINSEDSWAEDEYLKYHFYFENPEPLFERTKCLGLAAAHIYDSLSISFQGSPIWESNIIAITKVNDQNLLAEKVDVTNVFSGCCFNTETVQKFIERISEIVLAPSLLQPSEKAIHFRPDHGTYELNEFAQKIIKSPYVHGIINSLPWNPRNTNLIRRVYPDGRIELVLYWTDKGLGMVVQTTGRNQRETEEIAKLLEEEYT